MSLRQPDHSKGMQKWVEKHIINEKRYQTEVNVTIVVSSTVVLLMLIFSSIYTIAWNLSYLSIGLAFSVFVINFGIVRPVRYLKALRELVLEREVLLQKISSRTDARSQN